MIYIVVLVLLLVGLFFDGSQNPKLKKKWLVLEWLALVLLAGLRYSVGGDTIGYMRAFANAPSLYELSLSYISDSEYNILWILLTALCKSIWNDFCFFQIIHALIVNTAFFSFFYHNAKKTFLAVFIYFILFFFKYNTEILRASLSVSVFLFSYRYLENKNWVKYLLCSMIAIGFHSEAIFTLFFPIVHFLSKIKVSLETIVILVIITLLFMSINLIPILQDTFSYSSSMSSRVDYYADNSNLGSGITILGYLKIAFTSSIWLIFIFLFKKKEYGILRAFAFIAFFVTWQSYNYSNLFYRVLDFLQPILIVSICLSLSLLVRRKQLFYRFMIYAILTVMTIDRIVFLSSGDIILYYPYSSVFAPVDYYARELYFDSLWE